MIVIFFFFINKIHTSSDLKEANVSMESVNSISVLFEGPGVNAL
jgi:hypothetical protein